MNRRPGFSRVSDEPGAVHLLDATQRPPESAQGQDLFALLLAQDVGHPGAGSSPVAAVNVPARSAPLAGFQVSINGRFWVSPEAPEDRFRLSRAVRDRVQCFGRVDDWSE